MHRRLSLKQFQALGVLLRLRPSSAAYRAAVQVVVGGDDVATAARMQKIKYSDAWNAVKRIHEALDIVHQVVTD